MWGLPYFLRRTSKLRVYRIWGVSRVSPETEALAETGIFKKNSTFERPWGSVNNYKCAYHPDSCNIPQLKVRLFPFHCS